MSENGNGVTLAEACAEDNERRHRARLMERIASRFAYFTGLGATYLETASICMKNGAIDTARYHMDNAEKMRLAVAKETNDLLALGWSDMETALAEIEARKADNAVACAALADGIAAGGAGWGLGA